MTRMGTQRRSSAATVQQQATPTATTTSDNDNSNISMVPPPIVTHGPHFSSSRSSALASAASAGTSGNEVVIDGESSATDSDEDEVMVITPQSRKRNRTSAIMDEDNDDDEEEEEQETKEDDRASATGSASTTPVANKRMFLSPGLSDGSKAATNLPYSASLPGAHNAEDDDVENIDGEEDDEVEIVQIGSAAKPLDGSASKKNRRLTIEDTDDENDGQEQEQEPAAAAALSQNTPSRRHSSVGTPRTADRTPTAGVTPGSNASSSRRSSRIERKRQEKENEVSSSRRLSFLSLDNCLEPIQKTGTKDADGTEEEEEDNEDDDDDFEEEEEQVVVDSRRRKPQQRRASRETEREVLHADGDDDLDEFIVGDNEIEYMDDDENGVISVESGSEDDDENAFNELDDLAAHRAAQQTRERDEWFAIYMEYLEESIIDADLDNKMRRRQHKPEYQQYREAIHHIERELCSRRDSLRGNVVWPDEMMDAIKHASYFRSSRCSAEYECEACKRQNHMATYDAHLGGVSCDASELYRENWMQKYAKQNLNNAPEKHAPGKVRERDFPDGQRLSCGNIGASTLSIIYLVLNLTNSRTLAYWQLLHAKHFWCILVDAKRKEVGDVTGRIREQFRAQFFKQEFGRYKRLLNLVDTFETEGSRQTNAFMSNVWKKVTPQHYKSVFLPPAGKRQSADGGGGRESRRGTMDSFVAESDESEDEDYEEEEEQEENDAVNEEEVDEEPEVEQKDDMVHIGQSSRTQEDVLSTTRPSKTLASTASSNSNHNGSRDEALKEEAASGSSSNSVKPEATEVEDLLCLVCGENPRNGGIMHGQYLHFYCCFRCGKRQFRAKMGCLVCDRPIDKVLRLLPLTPEVRKAIKEQK